VKYYAHTATLPDGENDPKPERWQLLSAHFRNVADVAEKFAVPISRLDWNEKTDRVFTRSVFHNGNFNISIRAEKIGEHIRYILTSGSMSSILLLLTFQL
jgi:hypothetical protein